MATYAGAVGTHGPITLVRDYQNGANETGTILGTVKTQTAPSTIVPTYARVVLFRDQDSQPIYEQMSDRTTGAYSFSGMDKHLTYTVIAFHPALAYRAVLADGVFPT